MAFFGAVQFIFFGACRFERSFLTPGLGSIVPNYGIRIFYNKFFSTYNRVVAVVFREMET